MVCVYTYTPDMIRPLCPDCGAAVAQDTSTPETPWKGTCSSGHTFIFQLDDSDELEAEWTWQALLLKQSAWRYLSQSRIQKHRFPMLLH